MPHNYPEHRKTSLRVRLASKKAISVRLYGPDDPRTLAVSAELRFETLRLAIESALREEPPMTDDERRELAEMLLPEDWTIWTRMTADDVVKRVLG